jgi:hypothetical protein
MTEEPGSCGYNKRETKSIGYESCRIMPGKETLRYCGKSIRIGKTPESKPRRSWQPKQNKHDSWIRKRGSRRGRPTPRRRKVKLSEEPRTEVKPLGGPQGMLECLIVQVMFQQHVLDDADGAFC